MTTLDRNELDTAYLNDLCDDIARTAAEMVTTSADLRGEVNDLTKLEGESLATDFRETALAQDRIVQKLAKMREEVLQLEDMVLRCGAAMDAATKASEDDCKWVADIDTVGPCVEDAEAFSEFLANALLNIHPLMEVDFLSVPEVVEETHTFLERQDGGSLTPKGDGVVVFTKNGAVFNLSVTKLNS